MPRSKSKYYKYRKFNYVCFKLKKYLKIDHEIEILLLNIQNAVSFNNKYYLKIKWQYLNKLIECIQIYNVYLNLK